MVDIRGTAENDVLEGGREDDRLLGRGGDDLIFGGRGRDALYGGRDDDHLQGGGSADAYYGGAGIDTVDYLDTTSGVRVDLALGRTSFPGQRWAPEALSSIENALGGEFDDVLIGSAGANALRGAGGDDLLDGGGGNDGLYGGRGFDTATYAATTSAVRVDLEAQRVAFPGRTWAPETLASIEGAVGGAFADTLIGSRRGNVLDGGTGDDTLRGGRGDDELKWTGGADAFFGGSGSDSVVVDFGYDEDGEVTHDPDEIVYETPDELIEVFPELAATLRLGLSLAANTVTWDFGDGAETAALSSVETLILDGYELSVTTPETFGGGLNYDLLGTASADTIRMADGEHTVDGGDGDDLIFGGSSSPRAMGGGDQFSGDRDYLPETLIGGAGDDSIYGGGNFGYESNEAANWAPLVRFRDVLRGNGGDDKLYAGFGIAEITGGRGADEFHFTTEIRQNDPDFRQLMTTGVITDFNRAQGDKVVVEVEANEEDDPFEYVGLDASDESMLRIRSGGLSSGDGVDGYSFSEGPPEEYGDGTRSNIFGYYRSGSDTIVKVQMFESSLYDENAYFYDVALTIRLENYSGRLRESDIVLEYSVA